MYDAAVANEELGRLDQAFTHVGEVGLEAAHQHAIDQSVGIAGYRWDRYAQAARELRGVEKRAMPVAQHGPEAPECLGGSPQSGLGQVPLQIGADEVSAPPHARPVGAGREAVREATPQPERVQVRSRLQCVERGELAIGDASCQGLGGLAQQRTRRASQEQEVSGPAPGAPARVDLSAQQAEEAGQELHLIEDDQPVAVQIEVFTCLGEARGLGRVLKVHVQGFGIPACDRPRKRGLADLTGPEQDDRGHLPEVPSNQFLVPSLNHAR